MKYKRLLSLLILVTLTFTSFQTIDSFAVINKPYVVAEAAILMDGTTGQILYQKNAKRELEPASITKLLTALMAVENLDPEDTITFSRNAVLSIEAGSSHIGLREGETITVNDAMHGLLLMSANEVANGIAEEISGSIPAFSEAMNKRAEELGAEGTHFVNPNGLHDDNHYSTAYDMALITKELLKSDYFLGVMKDITYQIPPTNIVNETRYLSQGHKMINDKKNVNIYREDVIAGKTGYTTQAGHTLVTVAKRGDRVFIAVILNTLGPNLYTDTSTLLDYGFDAYKELEIKEDDYTLELPMGDTPGKTRGTAYISLKKSRILNVPNGVSLKELTYTPDLPTPIDPSLSKGDSVGKVKITYDGETIATMTLVIQGTDTDTQENDNIMATDGDDTLASSSLSFLIIASILLITGGGAGYLYYLSKTKASNYKAYKLKREAQLTSKDKNDSSF